MVSLSYADFVAHFLMAFLWCIFLRLFTGDVEVDSAVVRLGAVFPNVDALPCAKHHGAAGDGDAEIDVRQRGSDVGSHIIVAFVVVFVYRIRVRRQAGEDGLKIGADAGVGVFLNQQ